MMNQNQMKLCNSPERGELWISQFQKILNEYDMT